MTSEQETLSQYFAALKRLPGFRYLGEPVMYANQLYQVYPDGAETGKFALVTSENRFYMYDVATRQWIPQVIEFQEDLSSLFRFIGYVGEEQPAHPENGNIWLANRSDLIKFSWDLPAISVKKYNGESGQWNPVGFQPTRLDVVFDGDDYLFCGESGWENLNGNPKRIEFGSFYAAMAALDEMHKPGHIGSYELHIAPHRNQLLTIYYSGIGYTQCLTGTFSAASLNDGTGGSSDKIVIATRTWVSETKGWSQWTDFIPPVYTKTRTATVNGSNITADYGGKFAQNDVFNLTFASTTITSSTILTITDGSGTAVAGSLKVLNGSGAMVGLANPITVTSINVRLIGQNWILIDRSHLDLDNDAITGKLNYAKQARPEHLTTSGDIVLTNGYYRLRRSAQAAALNITGQYNTAYAQCVNIVSITPATSVSSELPITYGTGIATPAGGIVAPTKIIPGKELVLVFVWQPTALLSNLWQLVYSSYQLDDKLDKISTTTTYPTVYGKTTTGLQTMLSVSSAIVNSAVVQRNTNGTINTQTATDNNQATNLLQVKNLISAEVAASQTWLPAVATVAALPTITNTAKTWLCRVTATNVVYQCVSGQTAWAVYSSNTDYIDPTELASAMATKVSIIGTTGADRVYGISSAGAQKTFGISDNGVGGTLLRYRANGTVHVNDPSGATDAASKGYVDSIADNVVANWFTYETGVVAVERERSPLGMLGGSLLLKDPSDVTRLIVSSGGVVLGNAEEGPILRVSPHTQDISILDSEWATKATFASDSFSLYDVITSQLGKLSLKDSAGTVAFDAEAHAMFYGGKNIVDAKSQWLYSLDGKKALNWNNRQLHTSTEKKVVDWEATTLYDKSGYRSFEWSDAAGYDQNGQPTINMRSRKLCVSFGNCSLDWYNRTLLDSGNVDAANWEARQLYNSGGTVVLDWDGNLLSDSGGNTSADWENRHLLDSSGRTVIQWGGGPTGSQSSKVGLFDTSGKMAVRWTARQLLDSTGVAAANWSTRMLYDAENLKTANWSSRTLYADNEVMVVDWNSQRLRTAAGNTTVNWTDRKLYGGGGATTVDWGVRRLYDSYNAPVVDWESWILYDPSGYPCIEWAYRVLFDQAGAPIMEWWNGLGFFGATPVQQRSAIANATNATNVITQLNLLLAAMRSYGLIAS